MGQYKDELESTEILTETAPAGPISIKKSTDEVDENKKYNIKKGTGRDKAGRKLDNYTPTKSHLFDKE
jgi:hypothetical protein